ncbi:MAG: DUF1963 domain-containing protein [Oscillospiraceae bacterium]|nr:DUF1963 domain-containing protein [Oscillospiraceae bacterium]
MRDMSDFMEKLKKSTIFMNLDFEKDADKICCSKYGGRPAVPQGFEWPYYEGSAFGSDSVEKFPLSFIAQLNCSDFADMDNEKILPSKGILSFFYECDTQKWGFDPKDRGCARVYYFEDISQLSLMDFPDDLEEDFRFAEAVIEYEHSDDYPSDPEFELSNDEYDEYDNIYEEFYDKHGDFRCKLLGYPDTVQGDFFLECEQVAERGKYTGNGPTKITEEMENAAEDWLMLMQMDTIDNEKEVMMFGDCGRIYYCIRKQDLKERRFDKIWLILQCG